MRGWFNFLNNDFMSLGPILYQRVGNWYNQSLGFNQTLPPVGI